MLYKVDAHVTREGAQHFEQYTVEADSEEAAFRAVIDAARKEGGLERVNFLRYETGTLAAIRSAP